MQLDRTTSSDATSNEAVVSEAVGDRLKTLYDTVASEPVPDRFADLLNQLAGADTQNGQNDRSGED